MKFSVVKRFVEVLIIGVFLVGIFWIIFAVALEQKSQEMDNSEKQQALKMFTALYTVLIGFGAFLVCWSILGFLAAYKKVNCLLAIYNVGMFLILVISMLILIMFIYIKVEIPIFMSDTYCTKQKFLSELKFLNDHSYEQFCQQPCVCQFKGTAAEATEQNILNYTSTFAAVMVQQCSIFQTDEAYLDADEHTKTLTSIEQLFDCSGVCSINKYYVFRDVNTGIPQGDCKIIVLDYLDTNIKKVLAAAAVICLLFSFTLICSCCLCFKKKKGMSYYETNGVGFFAEKKI